MAPRASARLHVITTTDELGRLAMRVSTARRVLFLLDYDGTLAPFAARPELAAPDAELRELLTSLVLRAGASVHVVSGRPRETLDAWLGNLGVGLHAEHGLWSKLPLGEWVTRWEGATPWKGRARALMEEFMVETPATFVEEKSATLAWHYRMSDPEMGQARAGVLAARLGEAFRDDPVEVLEGDKVVEVRQRGVHKGLVLSLLREVMRGATVVAMGDDRTDEDLFALLPVGAIAIHVGPRPSCAPFRVPDVASARALLRQMLADATVDRAA